MATNISTSYAGEAAAGYVAAATLAGPTLGNPTITVHESVAGKEVVRNLDASGTLIADGNCDFVSSGDIDYSEGILDLKELQVNLQDCKLNWKKTWEQANRRALLLDQDPPADMANWMMERLAKRTNSSIETLVWQGDGDVAGQFDGLLKAISAAKTATPDVTGAADVTAALVIGYLEEFMDAVSDEVYSTWMEEGGFRIYMPAAWIKAYQLAVAINAGGSFKDEVTVGSKPLDYMGIPLVPAYGLPADTIVGAVEGDLHYGCNLLGDNSEVRLIDMADTDGSNNFRYVLRFEADTIITNPTNITWGVFATV